MGSFSETLALSYRVRCWNNFFWDFSEQPIQELELLPALLAIKLWAGLLCRIHVVFYLDNNAAHGALVRADGATPPAMGIVNGFVKFEKLLHLLPWLGSVP